MLSVTLVIAAALAYLVGAIPTGVILTRLSGCQDIRKAGSGNIGATNVARVAGKKLGVLTLAGDILKGALPVLLAAQLPGFGDPEVALVAFCAFVGHCYPVYLGFKGGKGVATALGVFLVLSPSAIAVAVLAFAFILWKWRYVSLGSVSAAVLTPFLILLFERSAPLFVAALLIGGLVVYRHKDNIQRLLHGTENKFKS